MTTLRSILTRLALAEVVSILAAALAVSAAALCGLDALPSLAIGSVAKIGAWVNCICSPASGSAADTIPHAIVLDVDHDASTVRSI